MALVDFTNTRKKRSSNDLVDTYTEEAVAKWPKYEAPPAPTGAETKAKITEWDMGERFEAMIHDIEIGPDGLVYAVDLLDDSTFTLDPKTGERKRYPFPKKGCGPHSIELGNDGNMWYTLCYSGEMAKFDLNTKEYTLASSCRRTTTAWTVSAHVANQSEGPGGTGLVHRRRSDHVFSMHPETMFVKKYQSSKRRPGGRRGQR